MKHSTSLVPDLNDTLEKISGLFENFYISLFCENNFSHLATTTIVLVN